MTQDILIVGLKHFLDEESIAYLLNTLTPEHEISLVLAEDNPVDKNAIQVWMPFSEDGLKKNMQIGFVSSDYTDLIRYNYPDARLRMWRVTADAIQCYGYRLGAELIATQTSQQLLRIYRYETGADVTSGCYQYRPAYVSGFAQYHLDDHYLPDYLCTQDELVCSFVPSGGD